MSFAIYLVLGAVAGGLINGLAGFGTAMFALGFWLQIMPPTQAVATVVVMSVVSGVQGVWLVRQSIFAQPARLARFVVPALFGIPIGVAVLAAIEPALLRRTLAIILLVYGGFFAWRRNLPKLQRRTPWIDGLIGFLGGVMGGAASLSGVLPTMWCALRPWSKSETRAVLQPFNMVVLGLATVAYALQGAYTWALLGQLAVVLPIALVSARIGIAVFKRLDDDQFRALIIAMMFLSGAVLLLRELFG